MSGQNPIGTRVKQVWQESGQSQEDFASSVGLSRTGLTNIMSGATDPKASTVQRIAQISNRDPSWFFQATAEPAPAPTAPAPPAPSATDAQPQTDLAAAIAQAVAQAVAQAQEPLLQELRALQAESADAIARAVTEAVAPLNAKLGRLQNEVRDQNRAQNRLNEAKYWPGYTGPPPPPDDAEVAGA